MIDQKRRFTFISSLSWDGVAIISAVVLCSLWFGSLSREVQNHSDQIKHLTNIYEQLSEAQKIQNANVSALTVLVNERTSKK
jgi:hypothetical protein